MPRPIEIFALAFEMSISQLSAAYRVRPEYGTGMPLDIRIRFGRAIRRIRDEQGINREEAAERCGLHRTYYSGIERGVRNISLVNIERIGKGLKTALPELFRRL